MLDVFTGLVGLAIGGIIGAFVFGQIIICLLYGVPVATIYWLRGRLKFRAVLHYLFAASLISALTVGACILLVKFAPGWLVGYLAGNWGVNLGSWLAIGGTVFSLLNPGGRRAAAEDFWQVSVKYLKASYFSEDEKAELLRVINGSQQAPANAANHQDAAS